MRSSVLDIKGGNMSSAARSCFVFAFYIVFMGVGLVFVPQILLPIFGLAAPQEVWVRVLGLLALGLSIYYFDAVRLETVTFFRMSIIGRTFFGSSLIILGLLTPGSVALGLFGLVDLAGAGWTWWTLRKS
jgi:hypothetical protein